MAKQFRTITASGTYDHFHRGHEAFLEKAFEKADHVFIGITADSFPFQKTFTQTLEPFTKRKENVEVFLQKNRLQNRSSIFALQDSFGPTLTKESPIEAIAVTNETIATGEKINSKRQSLGLTPLEIVTIPLIHGEDNLPVSSTRIRAGEINRIGQQIVPHVFFQNNHTLPDDLRVLLQKPTGTLFKGSEEHLFKAVEKIEQELKVQKNSFVITVGDVVTESFQHHHLPINIAIVDLKIKRQETSRKIDAYGFSNADFIITNSAGTISTELVSGIQKALRNQTKIQVIQVIGEEDLAVIPCILLAPLGTRIYYGQPNDGIVEVIVTEEKKEEMKTIMSKFQKELI